ncbi:MAG: GGDEF domain-containing protein, partial [Parasulfuritortus sp.]|nr:GGDEF domain-containing protein [Parasulfuritortus sp.]
VTDILSATRAARDRNIHLQQRLETTLAETESLKGELEQYRREATTDPLTGLYNRRAMETHLEELMESEAGTPLSVIMVDIDHFKNINDTYGHPLGDVVIRNVAQTILKCIRGDDFAVRFGGEEFVVLLPETSLDGATRVAETIRERIAALRLVRRHDNFTLAPFTVSLGVATRQPGDTQDSLFQRADRALYQSKDAGRNRVTIEGRLH